MRFDDRTRSFLIRAIGTLKGTPRQKAVVAAYVECGSEKTAAARLGMRPSTAKGHMHRFYARNAMDWIGHVIVCACFNLHVDSPRALGNRQDDRRGVEEGRAPSGDPPDSPSPPGS